MPVKLSNAPIDIALIKIHANVYVKFRDAPEVKHSIKENANVNATKVIIKYKSSPLLFL